MGESADEFGDGPPEFVEGMNSRRLGRPSTENPYANPFLTIEWDAHDLWLSGYEYQKKLESEVMGKRSKVAELSNRVYDVKLTHRETWAVLRALSAWKELADMGHAVNRDDAETVRWFHERLFSLASAAIEQSRDSDTKGE